MKKVFAISMAVLFTLSLSSCASPKNTITDSTNTTTAQVTVKKYVDVDLTELSSTMVYSEVNNMVTNPAEYDGKTVRMKGPFSIYQDEATGKTYYACIIADATACCQQGLEFVLDGNYTYPDDYPELGTEITISGIFGTYTEGENQYYQLTHATME